MAYMKCPNEACGKFSNEAKGGKCRHCGAINTTPRRKPGTQNYSARKAKINLFRAQKEAIDNIPEPEGYVYRPMRQFYKLRVLKGLTLAELSDRTGIGVTLLGRYESGKSCPSLKRMSELAISIGARVELVGWE